MAIIKICGDIKHPPFEFVNENKEVVGFNVDITKCIAEEMGLETKIDLFEWSDAIKKLQIGEYDGVQGMSKSGDREEKFLFGTEYITAFHSAFTLSERVDIENLLDIDKYIVAAQEDDVGYNVIKKSIPKDSIVVVSNQEEALKLLLSRKVDIIVGNKLTILYYVEEYGIEKQVKLIGSPLNVTRYGIAFNAADMKLAYKFNVGMNRIKLNGKYEIIYNKWFTQDIGYFGKHIIENVETGVIYIDKLGRITAINGYAIKIFNLKFDDLIFKSFYETKISEIFNTHMIQKILDKTMEAYYGKIKFQQDGNTLYIEANYLKLTDDKNDFMGVLINFKDITERIKLEHSLIRKDKMESLGFLLLNVAHEIPALKGE